MSQLNSETCCSSEVVQVNPAHSESQEVSSKGRLWSKLMAVSPTDPQDSQSSEERVERYWRELSKVLEVDQTLCGKWWKVIHDHYKEFWRNYHTLSHLCDMLQHLEGCQQQLQNTREVALAVYFHDMIYDPKASDNEEQSAHLFQTFADECLTTDCGVRKGRVGELILQTKAHQTDAHSNTDCYGADDEHYLLDFDMAVLGQEENVYDQYAANIRREYFHIPLAEYCQKRSQVLGSFLKTPRIYSTLKFHQKYEQAARMNITREIEALRYAQVKIL